ncbi:hypothetical protein D9757_004442 [Collybiopsis confluens]|uniref:Uncharacterized protein n=1 Tax=Collybiopsis confluens TaxID=2823264 RepID=A0A8H5HX09_9AGAR|nr:hypothetical protein D9757_004442 [Collybiopsis confluens]
MRLRHLTSFSQTMFMSKSSKVKAYERWVDSLTPIGKTPFQEAVFRSWASIDECDYNFHLSNSSYAKALDGSRFKLAVQLLPKFLLAGGVIPLAGPHFHFVREIPILAKYEVRISLEAWDEKWMYIVCRFVSRGKKERSKKNAGLKIGAESSATSTSSPTPNPSFFHAPISSSGISMSSTPLRSDPSAGGGAGTGAAHNPPNEKEMEKLTSKLLANASAVNYEEPDGATLHTITVSQMCFKMGRITVPPALVFAINGLCGPPPSTSFKTSGDGDDDDGGGEEKEEEEEVKSYSRATPPPHWDNVCEIVSGVHGGSIKKLRAFLRGGWKDVPEGERWWEQAMGGPVDERRRLNLEKLELLKRGMEGARNGIMRWG